MLLYNAQWLEILFAGMKFGFMQIKTGLANLLLNFNIEISPKIIKPLQFSKISIMKKSEDGIWLNFIKRNK